MTSRNPFTDGEPFSVVGLNSQKHAHQLEAILDGCELSTGSANFEVDIATGKILNDGQVDVSADTVDHGAADSEDRIDLITVDTNGDVSIGTGSPASTSGQPVAPDIPNDKVLLGAIYVRANADEILTGDIHDEYRTVISQGEGSGLDADRLRGSTTSDLAGNQLEESGGTLNVQEGEDSGLDADTVRGKTAAQLTSPIFGDGSDGNITHTSNTTESRIIEAVDYTIDSETTVSVAPDDGWLIVLATESITIDGTINGTGAGGAGGAGRSGSVDGDAANGNAGGDAVLRPIGEGGSGGSGDLGAGNGGGGGDGDTTTNILREDIFQSPIPNFITNFRELFGAGAGGGGGGGNREDTGLSGNDGNDGSFPGGGGGGSSDGSGNSEADGGDGGSGGALIVLCAPTISVSGQILSDGEDGGDGESTFRTGAGGGGGGSGGVIGVFGGQVSDSNATYSTDGGLGGSGGVGNDSVGGDGADGETGFTKIVRIGGT